jgi:isochorismate synthase
MEPKYSFASYVTTKLFTSPIDKSLFDRLTNSKIIFACYRLPGSKKAVLVNQKNSSLHFFNEKQHGDKAGFVFAPFNETKTIKRIFISASNAAIKGKSKANKAVRYKPTSSTRSEFEELVEQIKQKIRTGKFNKVVAARALINRKPEQLHPTILFNSLCEAYPDAFVSMVYTPQYGLWIGATPEILLEVKKNIYKTYALAGSMPISNQSVKKWGEKELEEHKLVADYIKKSFRKLGLKKPQTEQQESVMAGKLLHLRTTFTYEGLPKSKWYKAVKKLHPTPAVAGLPKKKSIEFIENNERSQRSFYSGYLGPVNYKNEIRLFVNLRCMQLFKNEYALYAGCGITASSIAAHEWKESELKMTTIQKIIDELT